MKVFIQRVKGRVHIESEFDEQKEEDLFDGPGLVVLLGWEKRDEERGLDLEKAEEWLRSRIFGLRIFPDKEHRMNLSLLDYLEANKNQGGILWVPQFTLAARLKSGYRPSFTDAMTPALAQDRFEAWKTRCIEDRSKIRVKQIFGVFGAEMILSFANWGPVSIALDQ